MANSTAGMIIGKAGEFIRHIQQETGAHIQISQKSKEMTLQERCVTVSGWFVREAELKQWNKIKLVNVTMYNSS